MRTLFSLVLVLLIGTCLGSAQAPVSTHLKVGDAAPDFTLKATDGSDVTLSSFRGKNTVVLAFFPAAFTGGCTREMQAYRDTIQKFEGSGAKVFGLSTDNLPSQKHWATEVIKTPVPLLSDFMREVSAKYGVLIKDRGIANRATFVIDKSGKITHIDQGTDAIDPTAALQACARPPLSR